MNSMLADRYRRLKTELYHLRQINSADTEAKEMPLVEEMVDIWYQLTPEDCETLEQEGFADPGSLANLQDNLKTYKKKRIINAK